MLLDRHQRKRVLFYSLWFSLGFGSQEISSENKHSVQNKKVFCYHKMTSKFFLRKAANCEKGIKRLLHKKATLNEIKCLHFVELFEIVRTQCLQTNHHKIVLFSVVVNQTVVPGEQCLKGLGTRSWGKEGQVTASVGSGPAWSMMPMMESNPKNLQRHIRAVSLLLSKDS